ncbi:MAG: V-containing nitrogenase subunit delta [Bacillota bacterium]|nr:V-containing nitrogenase subunit delta [Bacillota bacterium]
MEEKIAEIYNYIQERCLWQFHSRTWDRKENINGTMDYFTKILKGEEVTRDTAQQKCSYADAKILVDELKVKFSWVNELSSEQIEELGTGVKDKLIDIMINKSLNLELNTPFY